MGFLFHRFQQLTPNTWRRESGTSYALSSALHVLAAVGIAALFTISTRAHTPHFPMGLHGALLFGFVCWGVFALPIILEGAVFINLHPLVVVGRLLGLAFDFASRHGSHRIMVPVRQSCATPEPWRRLGGDRIMAALRQPRAQAPTIN